MSENKNKKGFFSKQKETYDDFEFDSISTKEYLLDLPSPIEIS